MAERNLYRSFLTSPIPPGRRIVKFVCLEVVYSRFFRDARVPFNILQEGYIQKHYTLNTHCYRITELIPICSLQNILLHIFIYSQKRISGTSNFFW
jgi:hypothetical protein